MSTLLLSRSDVLRSMEALPLLEDMRDAFRVDAQHRPAESPPLRPGILSGIPARAIRLPAWAAGAAASRPGVVHLYADTGELLAILDASHLVALRTGVVGALAADVLARPEASRVALLGAGPQASLQLKSLRLVRSLQHVRVYDENTALAVDFAARMYSALNLPVRPALSVEEAVEDADLVVALDTREPLLLPGMVRAGTHLSGVGADAPGLAAFSGGLLRQSTVFCDHRGGLGAEGLPTELGEVLAGHKPGRTDPAQVTVFGSVGPPFQDLVAAWHVYQGARGDEDVRRMDFEA